MWRALYPSIRRSPSVKAPGSTADGYWVSDHHLAGMDRSTAATYSRFLVVESSVNLQLRHGFSDAMLEPRPSRSPEIIV
jgi:hypothetical protein